MISFNPYAETLLLPGIIDPFGWSPDGRYLYAIRSETVGEGRRLSGLTSVFQTKSLP